MNTIEIINSKEPHLNIESPDTYEAWQLREIQEAIKEADAGLFVTDEEVEAIKNKWKTHAN